MSFNAIRKAWKLELETSSQTLVLQYLANCADDEDFTAHPSVNDISKKTKLNRKTVMAALSGLEKVGVISVKKHFGGVNIYCLHLGKPVPKLGPAKGSNSDHEIDKTDDASSTNIGTSTEIGPVPKLVLDQSQNRDDTSTNIGTLIYQEPINNQLTNNISPVKDSAPKESKKRKNHLPENFTITPLMTQWAEKNAPGIDPVSETEKFKDYHTAKGSTFADWVAAWRTWMRNAASFSKRPYAPPQRQAVNQSRHSGFENIDYRDGLTENPDGSFSF